MSKLSHSEEHNKKKDGHSPLSEITGYSYLLEYYNEHKETSWREWLEFDQTFEKPGKQGLVGLLRPTLTLKSDKPLKFVFKISQYINYLVQHEYTVMKGLNEISPYCPHFCKSSWDNSMRN